MRRFFGAVALLLLVPSLANALELSGTSTATPQLKSDTLRSLIPLALAATACDRVDSIQMSVISIPTTRQVNSQGVIVKGEPTRERWVASACGRQAAYAVTFTPDGAGGAYFNISADK